VMIAASRDGLVDAAREVGEGGLAAAMMLGALRYDMGARLVLDEIVGRDGVSAAMALFSESQGRVLCAVPRTEEERFAAMLGARGMAFSRVGVTEDSGAVEVQGQFSVPLAEAREAWEAPLPAHFG